MHIFSMFILSFFATGVWLHLLTGTVMVKEKESHLTCMSHTHTHTQTQPHSNKKQFPLRHLLGGMGGNDTHWHVMAVEGQPFPGERLRRCLWRHLQFASEAEMQKTIVLAMGAQLQLRTCAPSWPCSSACQLRLSFPQVVPC